MQDETDAAVVAINVLNKSGTGVACQADFARSFGVAQATVNRIATGLSRGTVNEGVSKWR